MHVHQLGELIQIAGFHRILALQSEFLDEMQIVDHVLVFLFALGVLLFQNAGGRARIAREKQQQVVLQIVQRLLRDLQRPRFDFAVGVKAETRDAAERGDVLVLFSDRLF